MKTAPELSWTPVERGAEYCSPACGRGCTRAEYAQAKSRGAGLATSMGPNWRVRVWENLGWHYSVVSPCGRMKIHPATGGGFHAYLGPATSGGGRWSEYGETPRLAIKAVLEKAEAEAKEIEALLKGWKT